MGLEAGLGGVPQPMISERRVNGVAVVTVGAIRVETVSRVFRETTVVGFADDVVPGEGAATAGAAAVDVVPAATTNEADAPGRFCVALAE